MIQRGIYFTRGAEIMLVIEIGLMFTLPTPDIATIMHTMFQVSPTLNDKVLQ